MKCIYCQDDLTKGEVKTHFKKPYFAKVSCYQCSQKQIEKAKARAKILNKNYD